MARTSRVRVFIGGDLAGALAWEAGRRGGKIQDLAQELLESAAAETIRIWRQVRLEEDPARMKPKIDEMKALQAVLSKAYGPGRRARAARRARA